MKHIGVIFSRLFVDSYLVEPIITQFSKNKTFLKSIMLLVSSHEKVSAIATSLRTSQELTRIYTKILMKLICN